MRAETEARPEEIKARQEIKDGQEKLQVQLQQMNIEDMLREEIGAIEDHDRKIIVGKEDHSKNSCFVCCVLSHGESGILYGSDGKYETERIFAPFRGDVCPTLAGKPKVFFIQACQGDKLDHGVSMKCQIATDSSSIQEETYRIPTHADFLIVYSTVSGFYSWRNTTNGSWFIQALCAALQAHAKDMDLLGLLTIVNRKVAYDFESFTPQDNSMHLKKQVPCVTSTLTRNIKFS
ncbi:caspase-like [Stegodyphus dumicola]|uniref:caspase-like n=1 Tax=Stegodyphus dumicola TaxID=202533 RepID=UPI0015ADEBAD|nr:caspase-like [Stegodyphus dumicola]